MDALEESRKLKERLDETDRKFAALENEARISSFDRDDFFKRVKVGDDWQRLIQAQIYMEFIAERFLEAELPNPKLVELERMSFSARLNLIAALALIPNDFVPAVRKLSGFRNKFAHKLRFEVTEKEVSALRSLIPIGLRKIAEEPDLRETEGPAHTRRDDKDHPTLLRDVSTKSCRLARQVGAF